jgi:hypothetical protein
VVPFFVLIQIDFLLKNKTEKKMQKFPVARVEPTTSYLTP